MEHVSVATSLRHSIDGPTVLPTSKFIIGSHSVKVAKIQLTMPVRFVPTAKEKNTLVNEPKRETHRR